MQKIFRISFGLALALIAGFAIREYYYSLPIRGAYERRPVNYPTIEKEQISNLLESCSTEELRKMKQAGLEVLHWQQLLGKVDSNVFADVIKDYDHFFIGDRYPYDESYDTDTQSKYFYHSHRLKEHGHFHVYFLDKKLMGQFEPISVWDDKHPNTHIAAISMHPNGDAIGLFLPNQWITQDEWFRSEDMYEMINNYGIHHPYPSWPTNQWMNHMLVLFKPQIKQLYRQRDQVIQDSDRPLKELVQDRKIDVLTSISISIPLQMEVIEELLISREPQVVAD